MDILEKTRISGNRSLRETSAALYKWFGRPKTKTKTLPAKITYATIDHDDEVGKLIAEYMYGKQEVED